MFPTDTDFESIKISTANEQSSKIGRSFLFDFKQGSIRSLTAKLLSVISCKPSDNG